MRPRAEGGSTLPSLSLVSAPDFAGDTAFILQETLVDAGRVETPTGGQQRQFVDVQRHCVGLPEAVSFGGFAIIEAFQLKFFFGAGRIALLPERVIRPGISPDNTAAIGAHPGMRMDNAIGAEELDLAELAAHFHYETEKAVDIITRFRQA